MAVFIVRVELHKDAAEPTSKDYDKLHTKMEGKGYARKVESSNGSWYELPSAQYRADKDATRSTVLDEVHAIAESVWTKFGVLVTEGNSKWRGLKATSK